MTLLPDDPRREKFVAALRDARSRIESGQADFVCVALLYSDQSDALRQWISRSMGLHRTAKGWLISQGVPRQKLTSEALRAYRIRWINRMIRYFGGKP